MDPKEFKLLINVYNVLHTLTCTYLSEHTSYHSPSSSPSPHQAGFLPVPYTSQALPQDLCTCFFFCLECIFSNTPPNIPQLFSSFNSALLDLSQRLSSPLKSTSPGFSVSSSAFFVFLVLIILIIIKVLLSRLSLDIF